MEKMVSIGVKRHKQFELEVKAKDRYDREFKDYHSIRIVKD